MDWTALDASSLNWDALAAAIPQAAVMQTCIQDPVFHAEGDVWTHTRMVVDALIGNPQLAQLEPQRGLGVLLAAIFHDVAKPATRDVVFDPELGRDRVTHHGHSKMGARDCWLTLWKAGVPLGLRQQVFSLIAAHQRPFHIFHERDPRVQLARFSAVGIWRELIMLAQADNNGRRSPNVDDTNTVLELLRLQCEEEGVLTAEWPFGSDAARTRVVRGGGGSEDLFYTPQAPTGSRTIVMSAPPGSGKDTYIAKMLPGIPVVSMDRLREELDVAADDNQGQIIQAALEEARGHLRKRAPFIWNTTGLSRLMRDKIVGLALNYDAQVEIHALDCPYDLMIKRNRQRDAAVPRDAIERMLLRWEPPMAGEAHRVVWIDARTFAPAAIEEPSIGLSGAPRRF